MAWMHEYLIWRFFDLTVFSDPIECRVLDGSCRFVCYCCCFLYGYRLDVCILNGKHDCFFLSRIYQAFKNDSSIILWGTDKDGTLHKNDLFWREVTELFKHSHIIYNILKWFFHKEVNLLKFIIYLHQSFFWAFRHCVHSAADIIKGAHNTRGTLTKRWKNIKINM